MYKNTYTRSDFLRLAAAGAAYSALTACGARPEQQEEPEHTPEIPDGFSLYTPIEEKYTDLGLYWLSREVRDSTHNIVLFSGFAGWPESGGNGLIALAEQFPAANIYAFGLGTLTQRQLDAYTLHGGDFSRMTATKTGTPVLTWDNPFLTDFNRSYIAPKTSGDSVIIGMSAGASMALMLSNTQIVSKQRDPNAQTILLAPGTTRQYDVLTSEMDRVTVERFYLGQLMEAYRLRSNLTFVYAGEESIETVKHMMRIQQEDFPEFPSQRIDGAAHKFGELLNAALTNGIVKSPTSEQ